MWCTLEIFVGLFCSVVVLEFRAGVCMFALDWIFLVVHRNLRRYIFPHILHFIGVRYESFVSFSTFRRGITSSYMTSSVRILSNYSSIVNETTMRHVFPLLSFSTLPAIGLVEVILVCELAKLWLASCWSLMPTF